MNDMKKFAIVTCATPNWLPPAAVTLLSCAQFGAEEFADLILVSFDIEPSHREALQAFNEKHGINISLLNIANEKLRGLGRGRLGVGSLLRLTLDDFLPHNLERVLYLDSDVLAEASCAALFSMSLQDNAIAAVENIALLPWIKHDTEHHYENIQMKLDQKYFNAGVMLFDWQKTLATQFLTRSLEALSYNPDWPFQDQDALNSVSQGHFKLLDHKYNVTKKTSDYLSIKPVFRHFNGAAKPWNSKNRFGFSRYHKYYLECLSGTPYQSFMDQPNNPWPIKDNWRAILRKLSFRKITKLKRHIRLVVEKD